MSDVNSDVPKQEQVHPLKIYSHNKTTSHWTW